MAFLSTVKTCPASTLNWCCLAVLLVYWGSKTRCLLIVPLELTSSWLIVLAILMLVLRILPLKQLLLRWALVLPELLRWVVGETRAIAASRLRSTDLMIAILHLFMLPLCHDCSINQVLKCGEGVVHQLIMQRVDQASQKTILPLGVSVDIFKSTARQLQKPVSVLTNRHWPLLECQELLLLHCYQTCRNMVLMEVVSEFFPGDGVGVGMGGEIGLPPRLSCSPQQTGTIQNFLSVITLSGVQLLLHCAQPVFSIHGVRRMSEHRRMTSHEFSTLVPEHLRHLRLRWWLLLLLLLNGG
jgi:hypothetical protein